MSSEVQTRYFNSVAYRLPTHPVVAAYADPKMDFIRRHVPMDGRILDIGCGNGIFTARFEKRGAFTVGLDMSVPLLRQNPCASLACGDALRLPFSDASFDVAFEANVLHHVDDREGAIREMARVSRRYVVLLEPNRNNPVMFAFSILVRAEHGGLRSSMVRLQSEIRNCGMEVVSSITTGMISQNNTPAALVPFLKRFDRQVSYGEYHIVVARKP